MSLVEQDFEIVKTQSQHFRRMLSEEDESSYDTAMANIRKHMLQLVHAESKDGIDATILNCDHPIIEEKGIAKLHLEFDVSKFNLEELKVARVGNDILRVRACHLETGEKGDAVLKYSRQYHIPHTVEKEHLTASLSQDGVLTIEAPAQPLSEAEKLKRLEFKK